jgi:NitT/TauT family transport system permease protein
MNSRQHSQAMQVALGIGGVVAFLAFWKAAYLLGWAQAGTIPDPFQVPRAFIEEWNSNRLLPAVSSSLIHYVWGLALGTVLGFAVGLLVATFRTADAFHAYLARILRPIPPLAWVVFAIAWFHVSHAGAAFVIAIGVFWVNYFATFAAVRSVDPRYFELADAFGHRRFAKQSVSIILPAAAPGILAGIRTGVGQAWMTLIAAELLGVPGMGQEMNSAAGVGAYDAVIVYMLAISVVYAASDAIFGAIERWLLRWRA